jgi:hypothetical protein
MPAGVSKFKKLGCDELKINPNQSWP